MIHLYDDAVVNRFREILGDDSIMIVPPERAKDVKAQLSDNDEIKFPLITLDRTGWSVQSNRINWSASRMGIADSISSNNKANILHAIPIRINYSLDVFTVDKVSADEIYRELIFYFLLHPTLMVNIPYGLDTEHVFNLFFNDDIEDNSDTVSHVDNGVLYRNTSTLYTDDAHLFANTPVNIVTTSINLETKRKREM